MDEEFKAPPAQVRHPKAEAMANDPPTSMKMRYGALDARDIGVTNFHQPRAQSTVEKELRKKKVLKGIVYLAKRHPSLKERFAKIVIDANRSKQPDEVAYAEMLKLARAKTAYDRIMKERNGK
jgi:hypothetical protein